GVNEAALDRRQEADLVWLRRFVGQTNATYQLTMRLLMHYYQLQNPAFDSEMIQKMIERGYDKPQFEIYSGSEAVSFLDDQGFGRSDLAGRFLVNFNLPRPIGRMWYRGGQGTASQEVSE